MANTYSLDLESSSSQYVSIDDASQTGLEPGTTGTWECWIKPESLPTSAGRVSIACKGGEGSSNYVTWRLNYDTGTGEVYQGLDFQGDNRDFYLDKTTALQVGVWQHIAVSWDITQASATTFEFYYNGVSNGNGTAIVANDATSFTDNTYPFFIGKNYDPNTPANEAYYDGLIDDFRFWNDVRTSTEIANNYKQELLGTETGLVGYWKFNNDYLDATANNNDLTATNSPIFSTDVPNWGTAYTQTLTDALALADSIKKDTSRYFLEAVPLVDTFSRTWTLSRVYSEAVSLVDSALKGTGKTFSEAVSVVDSFERAMGKLASETISLADSLKKDISRTFTDALSLTEKMAKRAGKVLTESLSLIDIGWRKRVRAAASWLKKTITSSTWSQKTPTSTSWTQKRGRGD